MERFTISKSEKQTIYEIYRACRLCGAGGGYRMPIIQNIIDLESSDVELRQKIQECLQLEVRTDDRMPPLICELCVDKVNDFYEFFNLTRQTNVRTRTRLGLPLQTAKKGEAEANDCILGVTEPVYVKDDEPPAKKAKAGPKCSKKIKKEPEAVTIKIENSSDTSRSSSVSSRSSRARGASPAAPPAALPAVPPAAPPAAARPAPRRARAPPPPAPAPAPKSRKSEPSKPTQTTKEKKERKSEIQNLLEDITKYDDNSLLVPRAIKRTREEPPRPALVPKRTKAPPTKEPVKEPTPPPPPRSKPGPKSKKKPEPKAPEPKVSEEKIPVPQKVPKSKAKAETPAKVKEAPKPPEESTPKGPYKCNICDAQLKTVQAHTSHLRCHTPTYTKLANACNPCGNWFVTTEEAATHHRYHRAVTFPYHCRRCFEDYRTLQLYNDHISNGMCTQDERPDVKCDACWGSFPTEPLRAAHRCPGEDGRPGGKCSNCSKTYATVKTLKKHESSCKQKRKRDLIADPDVLRRLKPMQVRIRRCDDLAAPGDYCDVSRLKPNYGLAKNYVYPYLKFSPVKSEPLHSDSMVAIPVALKEEFATDYTHWDSDDSDAETVIRRVPTLFTLAIKKLFSKHCLGKVPKRRKRVKNEAFDNDEFAISSDINDIISSLGNDLGNGSLDRKDLTARIKDIIGCLDESDVDGVENVGRNDTNDENVDKSKDENDAACDGELNKSDENTNESTKDNLIQSNEHVNEEASSAEISNSVEISDNVIQNNHSNRIEVENENLNRPRSETDDQSNITDDNKESGVNLHKSINNEEEMVAESEESENFNRPQSETDDQSNIIDDNKESDVNLQKSIDNEEEMVAERQESENASVGNVITDTRNENSFENESRSNDCNEEKNTEDTSKQVNKESPIKHSIENLIGDKNPDKYISEVISSIEDIINRNPRNEENGTHEQVNGHPEINEMNNSNVMDVLDENIGEDREKRISDNDKITLEDLLPKEDTRMELDNISDEDFNFDA